MLLKREALLKIRLGILVRDASQITNLVCMRKSRKTSANSLCRKRMSYLPKSELNSCLYR